MAFRKAFVDWGKAVPWLWKNKADGRGSSSTFRGMVHGKKYHLLDDRGELENGRSAGEVIVKFLKAAGAGRRPANNDNRPLVSPPRFAFPGVARAGFYIDIRAAYPSIYQSWAWDGVFLPDKGICQRGEISLSLLAGRLANNKFARNAVVGIALSRRRMTWTNGIMKTRPCPSGFFNPQLGWFLWAVLSWTAHKAREFGAIYFNTDGAIFRHESEALAWANWLESVGLDWSEKGSGDFIVWGIGSFSLIEDGKISGFTRRLSGRKSLLMSPVLARRAFDAWQSV